MAEHRIYKMAFSSVYPHYVAKATKKGRTEDEVKQIIYWLTGYSEDELAQLIAKQITIEQFYKDAPSFHPNASLIHGVICGVRIEEIEDELMKKVRYLDKLIDELAKGKSMDKILRKA